MPSLTVTEARIMLPRAEQKLQTRQALL
ncbi:TetR family transcriptional regulator, partial [Arthrobacter stackebrandtii]